MKRDICKRKKLNNKSSECNTIFDDTYRLYTNNIGIDYHHIKNRDKEKQKKRKLSNKSSESKSNTRIKFTLPTIQV